VFFVRSEGVLVTFEPETKVTRLVLRKKNRAFRVWSKVTREAHEVSAESAEEQKH
jgi:hypothetical protein